MWRLALLLFCCTLLRADEIRGSVSTPDGEMIRGAVVYLEDAVSLNVSSFITDENGHYRFVTVSGDRDYQIWVRFRRITTRKKYLSRYDAKAVRTVNLTLRDGE